MTPPSLRTNRADSTGEKWIPLPPSADVLQAIGGGHSFESALADIIDNSIDARASRVLVRFIINDSRLIAVQIRDDGTGMSHDGLVNAFRLGGRRTYTDTDLGHFGIGLKAASMRQAYKLSVYTAIHTDTGLSVAAATLDPADSPNGEVGIKILKPRRANVGYGYGYDSDHLGSGTVVEWSGIRAASDAADRETRQEWLDRKIEDTRSALGLVFHRKIETGDLRIEIDQFDAEELLAGAPRRVDPVNPFGYQLSGHGGYPRALTGELPDGTQISATCHILPPKGQDRGLPGSREAWQGIYVYRNDRLVTIKAGWQGIAVDKSELRLARASIELSDDLLAYASPNPEKNGVQFLPSFSSALQNAIDPESGGSFADYLEDSRTTWKQSSKRKTDKPLTEISGGLPRHLVQQLSESFGWRSGHESVAIVWEDFAVDDIFKLDLERRVLAMNSAHADRLGGEESPQANAIAALLFLLVESNFTRSSHLRSTTHDYLEHIDSALLAALYSANSAPELRRTPTEALAKLRAAIPLNHPLSTTPKELTRDDNLPDLLNVEMTMQDNLLSSDLHLYPATTTDSLPLGDSDASPLPEETLPGVGDFESGRPASSQHGKEPANEVNLDVAKRFGGGLSSKRSSPLDPLTADDLAVFNSYCTGAGIGEVAAELGREKADVAASLTLAFFGSEALDDDASLAPFHGMPYTPDERERIVKSYRAAGDGNVDKIARENGRTPFAVAWLLLDSPKRPVSIDKGVRKNVRRRVSNADR